MKKLSESQKTKISFSLSNRVFLVKKICPNCELEFSRLPGIAKRQLFCSRSCAAIHSNKRGKGRIAGLASAAKQRQIRRSKNEILFSELCATRFTILTNERMFNGWDADVIIPSLKIAVLWNGAWHYKQISKQSSLLQIQNRDRLKFEAIISTGYKPYVIKDMGKFSQKFVHEQFELFMKHIAG